MDPHEEISQLGFEWTPLHYACHFKSPDITEFLIQVAYTKYTQDYENIMNV